MMYFRRFILGAVIAMPLLGLMAGTAHAQTISPEAAKSFIQQSGQQLQSIINSSAPQAQKADQLRQLVNRIVAVDQIGDYVLGPYIRVITPQQHARFLQLFHQLLSYNITYQIRAYRGVNFTVNNAVPQGNDIVVNTTVTSPGKAPAEVGWAVEEIDGRPKIVDVIVAGTSLRITTRNDYSGVITGHGGQVSALLNAMQGQITRIANAQ